MTEVVEEPGRAELALQRLFFRPPEVAFRTIAGASPC
jgi:hypothetical protein